MLVVKKNQIIVTSLVIMVAIAGYLNYADKQSNGYGELVFQEEFSEEGALVSDEVISNNVDESDVCLDITKNEEDISADGNIGEAATYDLAQEEGENDSSAVFVSSDTAEIVSRDSFFAKAKLDREQTRSQEREWLTGLVNNKNIESKKRSEAAESLLSIQDRIEKESAAETLIEAKGFKNAYVRIDDKTIDVVVDSEVLSEADIAIIEDIVKRKTGIAAKNIRISTFKNQ